MEKQILSFLGTKNPPRQLRRPCPFVCHAAVGDGATDARGPADLYRPTRRSGVDDDEYEKSVGLRTTERDRSFSFRTDRHGESPLLRNHHAHQTNHPSHRPKPKPSYRLYSAGVWPSVLATVSISICQFPFLAQSLPGAAELKYTHLAHTVISLIICPSTIAPRRTSCRRPGMPRLAVLSAQTSAAGVGAAASECLPTTARG